jgi:phosphatidylethanolamine/phosphatidyl-N-methylethanolamine N-methyltransferase
MIVLGEVHLRSAIASTRWIYQHCVAAILRRAVKLGYWTISARLNDDSFAQAPRGTPRPVDQAACFRLPPIDAVSDRMRFVRRPGSPHRSGSPICRLLTFCHSLPPAVAALMTRDINARTGPVIELGPGTGPFTYALLDRGVREQDLTLIEYGSDFLPLLQTRFPKARVLWMDAAWLDKYPLFEEASVGAIISGLGILTMPPRKVIAILTGAFSYLRPDGAFYQITYGPRCPVSDAILDRLDLEATRIGQTLRNVPPASVYRIARRKPEAV